MVLPYLVSCEELFRLGKMPGLFLIYRKFRFYKSKMLCKLLSASGTRLATTETECRLRTARDRLTFRAGGNHAGVEKTQAMKVRRKGK